MSTLKGHAWIVATEGPATDRSPAWPDEDLEPVPLAWGAVKVHSDAAAATAALAEADCPLVMFTSAYAVRALPGGSGSGKRAACVGAVTAAAARDYGFEVLIEGTRGGAELARQIAALDPPPSRVLWLRGERARPEARAGLQAAGIPLHEIATYGIVPRPEFNAEVAAAPDPQVVVFGSPRAAEALHATGVRLGPHVERWVHGEVTGDRVRALFGGDVRTPWRDADDDGD